MKILTSSIIIFFIAILNSWATPNTNNIIDTNLSIFRKADNIEKIKILLDLSDYFKERTPQKSIEYAKQAFEISSEAGAASYQAKALFAIGTGYYHQNNYDQSLKFFINSLSIFEKINDQESVAQALNRIGNVYQLKGNFEKAFKAYQEALSINKKGENKTQLARSYTNLGSIAQLYGDYNQAIEHHLKALEIHELMDNQEGMAWADLNIARLFRKMGNFEKALEYINRSLKIYEDVAKFEGVQTGVTLCLKEIGTIYQDKGDFEKALLYNQQVLSINQKTDNQYGISTSLSSIGKIYFLQGKNDLAFENLTKSLDLKLELNDINEFASTLRYIGEIYLIKRDFNKAFNYLNQSLEFAKKQSMRYDIKEAYLSLANAYSQKGNHEKSLDFYIHYASLKDSLNSSEIAQRELQFEFNKKEKIYEVEQLKQKVKLQKQSILIYSFIIGSIVLLLFVIVIYRNFRAKKKANQLLALQNEEIKLKNLQIEQQKGELSKQRDTAEYQRDEITKQKQLITDSIQYAKRIQNAILPQTAELEKLFPEHFIYYQPKDIVSGDFYWTSKIGDKLVIAVADCTGHGVPGAFMSMLGIAFLNEIVVKNKHTQPNIILEHLRKNVIEALHQNNSSDSTKDGMDISLLVIDTKTNAAQFAGAHNSLLYFTNNEIIEIKADRMPIGIYPQKQDNDFTNHEIKYNAGDTFYLFSDGYLDQFGGANHEKFKRRNFIKLLTSIQDLTLNEQKIEINKTLEFWMGDKNQVDDILIIGIKP